MQSRLLIRDYLSDVNIILKELLINDLFHSSFWSCQNIFPGGSDGKESSCSLGVLSLIPALGRSPGGGNGNPFQYSFLENSMDRGAWWAIVHGWQRVRHDWATKHKYSNKHLCVNFLHLIFIVTYFVTPKKLSLLVS